MGWIARRAMGLSAACLVLAAPARAADDLQVNIDKVVAIFKSYSHSGSEASELPQFASLVEWHLPSDGSLGKLEKATPVAGGSFYAILRLSQRHDLKTDKPSSDVAEVFAAHGLILLGYVYKSGPGLWYTIRKGQGDADFPQRIGSKLTLELGDSAKDPISREITLVNVGSIDSVPGLPNVPGPFYVIRSTIDPNWHAIWSEALRWPVDVAKGSIDRRRLLAHAAGKQSVDSTYQQLLKQFRQEAKQGRIAPPAAASADSPVVGGRPEGCCRGE